MQIPARPEYVRLARLAVAGLASRMGFTFDEVEDLRMAVDELHHCLMGAHGRPGQVELTCVLRDDAIVVEGVGTFDPVADGSLSELSQLILDAVVDEFDCSTAASPPSFRLVKRRTTH